MTDARFEEGHERPLNIGALDPEDLSVISALTQDAVFPITEMRWQPRARRFALLINRFRWEDTGRDRHGPERVQTLLVLDDGQEQTVPFADQLSRVAQAGAARVPGAGDAS